MVVFHAPHASFFFFSWCLCLLFPDRGSGGSAMLPEGVAVVLAGRFLHEECSLSRPFEPSSPTPLLSMIERACFLPLPLPIPPSYP